MSYVRPSIIPADMGGSNEILDGRLSEVFQLLKFIPLSDFENILDVGMGKGQTTKWFAKNGKQVTGTGLEFDSYEMNYEELKTEGIALVECSAEKMPFPEGCFDAVIMCHVLEHCYNVGNVLQEVRRVLKEDGWLFVFVPRHDDFVCAGHVSMGWNLGQLMYTLLLNGYAVNEGHFLDYSEQNVVAFVRKSARELPALRGDRGDIFILQSQGYFPRPVVTRDGFNDGFYGDLRAINWDTSSLGKPELMPEDIPPTEPISIAVPSLKKKLIISTISFFPKSIQTRIANFLSQLAIFINGEKPEEKTQPLKNSRPKRDLINPDSIKG